APQPACCNEDLALLRRPTGGRRHISSNSSLVISTGSNSGSEAIFESAGTGSRPNIVDPLESDRGARSGAGAVMDTAARLPPAWRRSRVKSHYRRAITYLVQLREQNSAARSELLRRCLKAPLLGVAHAARPHRIAPLWCAAIPFPAATTATSCRPS